jgi:hypothetical protein
MDRIIVARPKSNLETSGICALVLWSVVGDHYLYNSRRMDHHASYRCVPAYFDKLEYL